jgi:L-ascorbate metabolism protein UlaG (beta-lactamase superfamily)
VARNRYYAGAPSDHFDGVRFFNPGQAGTDRSLADMLRWKMGGGRARWPARVANAPAAKPSARVSRLTVTMVGHATVLIQLAGCNLLVDPVWSERASPLRWAGPKRVNDPGVAFADLPPIDAVLITHNHYDHFDITTLRRLWSTHRPRLIAPLGNDALLAKTIGASSIEAADWGDTIPLGDQVRVTLVAAHHWSARALGDRRMALWCGFVIQSPAGLVYNAGDTGYRDGGIFFDIARRFGAPDVAILPIGAYEPRWFMKDQHADPDEAVRIMMACEARQGLGVHWGTFQLTDEARIAPKEALAVALRRHEITPDRFLALEPGDVWSKPADIGRCMGGGAPKNELDTAGVRDSKSYAACCREERMCGASA